MANKQEDPKFPMMNFTDDEPRRSENTLSFVENDTEEERIPTNKPLRFFEEDNNETIEESVSNEPTKTEPVQNEETTDSKNQPAQTEEKAEPKPAVNPEPKPATTPEPKPAVTPEPKPATTPETRPIVTQWPKPEVKAGQTKPMKPANSKPETTAQPKAPQLPTQEPEKKPQMAKESAYNTDQPADNSSKNKVIKLLVVNNAGVGIQNFSVNGKPVDYGQTITFRDNREVYDLTISADGFKDKRVQITHDDLQKGEKRIALSSQAQSLTVGFNTPEGIKRGTIEIELSNPIYEYFKEASHTDTPLNTLNIEGVGGANPNNNNKPSLRPYIIVFFIGMILGCGLMALFSGGDEEVQKDATETVDNSESTQQEAENNVKEETLNPNPETEKKEEVKKEDEEKKDEEEKSDEDKKEEKKSAMSDKDVEYYKKNDVWKKGQAESDAGKGMMSAFYSGNIGYLINSNPYNDLPSEKRNGYYNKVLKDLIRIEKQKNYDDAKSAMREACKNGEVDLKKVLDAMHRKLL